jgi:hypothetical protein
LDTERVVPVVIFLRRGERPGELILGGDRHHYLARHGLRPIKARSLILRSPLVAANRPKGQGPRAKGRGGLPWPSALGPFALERLVAMVT